MKFLNIETETIVDAIGERKLKSQKFNGISKHAKMIIKTIKYDDFENRIHIETDSLNDLKREFSKISKKEIIYCINMNEVFQLLTNIMKIDEVFTRVERDPIFFKSGNIEVRSFESISGERIEDTMKKFETDNKNKAMHLFCVEKLKQYKKPGNIPLTFTGELRRELKQYICDNWYDGRYEKKALRYWNEKMNEMTNSFDYFKKISDAFIGGLCDFNQYYRGKVVENVKHWDIDSSYIWAALANKFPCERFVKCDDDNDKERYAYLYEIECDIIDSKKWIRFLRTDMNTLRNDDEILHDETGDKILSGHVRITLTDIDFELLKETYIVENIKKISIYKAYKDYLPLPVYRFILEKYKTKKQLKQKKARGENIGKALDIAKQKVNSVYGCMVTNLIFDEISYDEENGWNKKEFSYDECMIKLDELKKSKKIFLNYAWGVWISAFARMRLLEAIFEMQGNDSLYCDTDSIFHIGDHQATFTNSNIYGDMMIMQALKERGLFDEWENIKGIGRWEFQKMYSKFKTLGKKKYITDYHGKIEMTHAGINKKLGAKVFSDINDFKKGFVFDSEHSGRIYIEYIDDKEFKYFIKLKVPAKIEVDNYAKKIGVTTGYSKDMRIRG